MARAGRRCATAMMRRGVSRSSFNPEGLSYRYAYENQVAVTDSPDGAKCCT
ncbi:hypothetical protein KCP76_20315 [Salmonella enterica subsp. enterica serovar Weltevreden]|nr:hypothetical protein KCP76_20315 [Salmonella enterica subsp. enterica serovar Weltevreden]